MASLLKASNEIRKDAKGKGKGRADDSSEVAPVKMRKDKVLMLCSRGVTQRHRHLMRDLEVLLPHTKKGEVRSAAMQLNLCFLIRCLNPHSQQTPSSTPNPPCTSSTSWPTCIRVTTPCISNVDDTRISTCGSRVLPTAHLESFMSRISTRWTS